jgi:hypothetical protein
MTATEWLFLQLYEKFEMKGDGREMDKVLEQAKAMEKEQMEDCWIAAHQAGRFEGKGIAQDDWQTFFNYYNETYGS